MCVIFMFVVENVISIASFFFLFFVEVRKSFIFHLFMNANEVEKWENKVNMILLDLRESMK